MQIDCVCSTEFAKFIYYHNLELENSTDSYYNLFLQFGRKSANNYYYLWRASETAQTTRAFSHPKQFYYTICILLTNLCNSNSGAIQAILTSFTTTNLMVFTRQTQNFHDFPQVWPLRALFIAFSVGFSDTPILRTFFVEHHTLNELLYSETISLSNFSTNTLTIATYWY